MASALALKTAIGSYGHTRALKDGSLQPDGVTLEHVEVSPIIAAFRRMIRNAEFDVSEMAISTYLCARAHAKPITALPVFLLRGFQHGSIVASERSGIRGPADLAGRWVGVRAYTVTMGVWVRGILREAYDVDHHAITWVVVDEEHVQEYELPPNVLFAGEGAELAKLLAAGEIDAAVGVAPDESNGIRRVIPDAEQAAADYFRERGVYPINHTLVVKDEVLGAHPWLAASLLSAFSAAKQVYIERLAEVPSPEDARWLRLQEVVGADPLPYGVRANRPTLEAIIRFNLDQGIIPRAPSVKEIFDAGVSSV